MPSSRPSSIQFQSEPSPACRSVSAVPVVLSIAGYDPSAGAGVLADLKTLAALGVYGMACITALTVQSTQGVRRVEGLEPGVVVETLECLAEDACFSSIKVGMLSSEPVAAAVLKWLEGQASGVPVVLDPVTKSSSGKDLLDEGGRRLLRRGWLARAGWITPNLAELADLTGDKIPNSRAETEKSAGKLLHMAAEHGNAALKIVVTGGHAEKPDDLLVTAAGSRWYSGERVETTSTHGTGCAFSAALAAGIALQDDDFSAVLRAKQYITEALRHAYPVGHGKGSPNHFWR